jgi:hypothetical protein
MTVSASSWVVLGARETPTWATVADWLEEFIPEDRGILILDEIDKVHGDTDPWSRYLRSELFGLLDGLLPPQVKARPNSKSIAEALRRTLIIGCGTFQAAFEAKPSVGFLPTNPQVSNLDELSKFMHRELLNRFRPDLLILRPMDEDDYIGMLKAVVEAVPGAVAEKLVHAAELTLADAVRDKLGARWLEGVISSAYIECVSESTHPTPAVPPKFEESDTDSL